MAAVNSVSKGHVLFVGTVTQSALSKVNGSEATSTISCPLSLLSILKWPGAYWWNDVPELNQPIRTAANLKNKLAACSVAELTYRLQTTASPSVTAKLSKLGSFSWTSSHHLFILAMVFIIAWRRTACPNPPCFCWAGSTFRLASSFKKTANAHSESVFPWTKRKYSSLREFTSRLLIFSNPPMEPSVI